MSGIDARQASEHFDAQWYLETYPDVKALGMDPLEHYLWLGARLGRKPFGTRSHARRLVASYESYGEYFASFEGPATTIDQKQGPVTPRAWTGTLAVHLHLYHAEMKSIFFHYLKNIPVKFDLFVSISAGEHPQEVRDLFRRLPCCNDIIVDAFPNKGRDIAPLLAGYGNQLQRYDYFVHIHSKKSVHNRLKRDWVIQLLHHLLGSRAHFSALLDMFADDKKLGLLFPIYHSSLRNQISWGTNFSECVNLASRLAQNLSEEDFLPFPAGSFFLARTSSLRPLLTAGLTFDDFPKEQGQVDGTLAHAAERMLTVLASREGYHSKQVRSSKTHTLSTAYLTKGEYWSPLLENARPDIPPPIQTHRVRTAPNARTCFFTCSTNGYDGPLIHESTVEGAEYVFFSDNADCVVPFPWRHDVVRYWDVTPVRIARFHKTNPHNLFENCDIAIWVDANVAIVGDVAKYIDLVIESNASFGVVAHPFRKNAYEEADALLQLRKDQSEIIRGQMNAYREEGMPETLGLTETNFLIMDLRKSETRHALDVWCREITKHSHRDQLSFDYACWKAGAKKVSLLERGGSVRSDPDFAYFAHGGASYAYGHRSIAPAARPNGRIKFPVKTNVDTVQIVICVHNALSDVRVCLESVASHTDGRHRVLVIDDNSGEETAGFLRNFARGHASFDLRTLSGGATGYCKAANQGLLGTEYGDAILLLNSDTIVGPDWLERLISTANSLPSFGIVGPMSNAASFQSLPDIKARPDQTAINVWPDSVSLEDLNRLCQEFAGDMPPAIVPLVHGFCQLISRQLLRKVGGFDEQAFPNGYGEENDLCFRGWDAGFRHQVDLRTFVHHEKSKSYTNSQRRQALMSAGSAALKKRYGERRIANAIKTMEDHPTLQCMRERARDRLSTIVKRGALA